MPGADGVGQQELAPRQGSLMDHQAPRLAPARQREDTRLTVERPQFGRLHETTDADAWVRRNLLLERTTSIEVQLPTWDTISDRLERCREAETVLPLDVLPDEQDPLGPLGQWQAVEEERRVGPIEALEDVGIREAIPPR